MITCRELLDQMKKGKVVVKCIQGREHIVLSVYPMRNLIYTHDRDLVPSQIESYRVAENYRDAGVCAAGNDQQNCAYSGGHVICPHRSRGLESELKCNWGRK